MDYLTFVPRAEAAIGFAVAAVAGALLASVSIAQAQNKRQMCSGEFVEMRIVGLQLGDCDLNHIPKDDLNRVKKVCGEPSGVGDHRPAPKCSIQVIASSNKSLPAESHGYGARVYRVQRVLGAMRGGASP